MADLTKSAVAIATVALGSVAITTPEADAIPVTYDFMVNVTQGPLAGQSFKGTFSYDDAALTGTDIESLGVDRGLTVCMNYFGRNFSENDDTSYPTFPQLLFENRQIKQLDFWIQPNQRANWWNLPGWEVTLSQHPAMATPILNCQKP